MRGPAGRINNEDLKDSIQESDGCNSSLDGRSMLVNSDFYLAEKRIKLIS